MTSVTFTLTDTPTGGVAIKTDFHPAVGNPCSAAQAAALDIISRTRREYGLELATGGLVPKCSYVLGEKPNEAVDRTQGGQP
jgi:hypothetical protein